MKNIIINFCPTGVIPNKDMTKFVPISPEEIAEQTFPVIKNIFENQNRL